LFRTSEIKEIIPKLVTIEGFDISLESVYVLLADMQFAKELVENAAETLAGASNDRFQGERELESCKTHESVVLSTSVYSDFKSLSIPTSQGSISGILSKDFFGNYYVLRINTSNALDFVTDSRCDIAYLECDTSVAVERTKILLEEGFETATKVEEMIELGWENVNSNGDDKLWENKKIRNVANRVMTISAFNSKLNPLEAWLITPEIDMDKTTNEILSFEIQTGFNNGKILTILASTDYTGDPKTTKWLPLDIDLPANNANKILIDPFPVSCLNGKLRIAFRYNGRDPGATSTYTLDNVKISGMSEK